MGSASFDLPGPGSRRRLGSGLAELGKLLEAIAASSASQVPLSDLTTEDQEKLFTKPKCEYRFVYQPDGFLKLQEVEVEDSCAPDRASSKRTQDRNHERPYLYEGASLDYYQRAKIQSIWAMQDAFSEATARARARAAQQEHASEPDSAEPHKFDKHNRGMRRERAAGDRGSDEEKPYNKQERDMRRETATSGRNSDEDELSDLRRASDTFPRGRYFRRNESCMQPIGTKPEPATDVNFYPSFCPPSLSAHYLAASDRRLAALSPEFDNNVSPKFKAPGPVRHQPSGQHCHECALPGNSPSPDHGSDTTATYPFNSPEYCSDSTLLLRRLSNDSGTSMDSVFDKVTGGGAAVGAAANPLNPPGSWVAARGGLGNGLNLRVKTLSAPQYDFIPSYYHQEKSLPSPAPQARSPAYANPLSPITGSAQHFQVANAQPYPGITFYDYTGSVRRDDALLPEYWATKGDKARLLDRKLYKFKIQDVQMQEHPDTKVSASTPIHIIVDLSNIIIGFYDTLKRKRGIAVDRRMKAPGFSFDNFHAILARGRQIGKSVVGGSRATTLKDDPAYIRQAEALGYEMNIMFRVPKHTLLGLKDPKPPKPSPRGSAPPTAAIDFAETQFDSKRKAEQGVDEVLHLKILQSAIDHRFGTLVLATGDAAEAEYSDGFKKNVERALNNGWNLELYGWSRSISSAWRDPVFLANWGDRVRIIELDQFAEELYEMSVDDML